MIPLNLLNYISVRGQHPPLSPRAGRGAARPGRLCRRARLADLHLFVKSRNSTAVMHSRRPYGMGRRKTYRELELELEAGRLAMDELRSKFDEVRSERDELARAHDSLRKLVDAMAHRMSYYENVNSPPSANSLVWKKLKKKKNVARKSGDGPERKKPGGRKGHKGTARRHDPARSEHHAFEGGPPVCCGQPAAPGCTRTRDITDIPPVVAIETRHHTDTAQCRKCGKTFEAESGLPKKGSFGRNLIGAVAELRSHRVPYDGVARASNSLFGCHVTKSTVINMLARVGDAMEREAKGVMDKIYASPSAGIDESGMSLDGIRGWIHVIQSGPNVFIVYNRSRGSEVIDAHMDGYGGCVTTDGHRPYKVFDPGGKHQDCWSHELRNAVHVADADGAHPDARLLAEDLLRAYVESILLRDGGAPSARLRRAAEVALGCMLDRYRGSGDERLEKLVARIERAIPILFTFLEYPEAEPTNNSSERALRYAVVFRKISGQIKGGSAAMRRMSNFVTCVLTWRAHGKGVAEEVAKLV